MKVMKVQKIKIEEIAISGTNPRKRFDPESIDELAESIKKNGLIQPITLRPVEPGKNGTSKFHKYEIVAGERRYRACTKAFGNTGTVDSIVRELTDEEAFEVQVVENLQREDVHPIDEAEGFARMIETGRYDVKEIAARMGKSESFVQRRLKLNDLIRPLKDAFYQDVLGVTHALEICRLSVVDQEMVYQKCYSDKAVAWQRLPKLNQLKDFISHEILFDLKSAPFALDDTELYPEAGSCIKCPKRSGANPSLFGDIDDKNQCFDGECFKKKCDLFVRIKIEEFGGEMPLVKGYMHPDHEPSQLKELEKDGHIILEEYDDFWFREDPDEDTVKALCVAGSNMGQIVNIELNSRNNSGNDNPDPETPEGQKQKIIDREARAVELDREKVQRAIIEHMGEFYSPEVILSKAQVMNFATVALFEAGFDTDLSEEIKRAAVKWDGADPEELSWSEERKLIIRYLIVHGSDWAPEILRSHYQDRFTSSSELDPNKWAKAYAYKTLAQVIIPEKAKEIEDAQAKKAKARKARVDLRLAELEKQAKSG